MANLIAEKCEACTGDTPTLTVAEVAELRAGLHADWIANSNQSLRREFKFKNFNAAFSRATAIALLAEAEGHHPDMEVGWGRLVVVLTTHAVKGLSRNDFILAAKVDRQDAAAG